MAAISRLPKIMAMAVVSTPMRGTAMMVFSTTLGPDTLWLLPSERNSNLLPVKAKGDVRLRSVESLGNLGRMCTPSRI